MASALMNERKRILARLIPLSKSFKASEARVKVAVSAALNLVDLIVAKEISLTHFGEEAAKASAEKRKDLIAAAAAAAAAAAVAAAVDEDDEDEDEDYEYLDNE